MDSLNQILNSFSGQIADGSVSFNPDIFESNVVNITILAGGLFFLLSDALSTSLSERQQKILGAIQESEERLTESAARLAESEKQLEQAQLIIDSIGKDAQTTASQVKSAILTDGKAEIERLTSTAKSQINTFESKVRKKISDHIINLAIKEVKLQLDEKLDLSLQQKIIDNSISKLGE